MRALPHDGEGLRAGAIGGEVGVMEEEVPYSIKMVRAPAVLKKSAQAGMVPGMVTMCVVNTGYDLSHPDLPAAAHGVDGASPYGPRQLWDVDGHGHV